MERESEEKCRKCEMCVVRRRSRGKRGGSKGEVLEELARGGCDRQNVTLH